MYVVVTFLGLVLGGTMVLGIVNGAVVPCLGLFMITFAGFVVVSRLQKLWAACAVMVVIIAALVLLWYREQAALPKEANVEQITIAANRGLGMLGSVLFGAMLSYVVYGRFKDNNRR